MNIKLKPTIKWAGGKTWLVPKIENIISEKKYTKIIEPFAGGMAITLGLNPKEAILNDINPHLINFYRWLQKGLIIDSIDIENSEENYYFLRNKFNNLIAEGIYETKLNAEIFYFLNKQGYNGLCRFNKKGFFNVPYGKYKRSNIICDLTHYKDAIAPYIFLNSDFECVEEYIECDSLVFVDPPYDKSFTKYSKEDFTGEDRVRLVEWLNKIPGDIIATDLATDRVIELYSKNNFKIELVEAPRKISCKKEGRVKVTETIATRIK